MATTITKDLNLGYRVPGRPIVQVGLDGSWGQISPHVFSYGGVAGNQFVWNALDPLWQGLLERHGLTEFHMVDAVNFRGEFAAKSAEWGEQRMGKLNEVICDFVDAIRQVNLEVVVCSAEESALSPEGIAAKKRDVFEHVVRQLHDDMRAKHAPHVLMFICDREQDMVKPVVGWLDKLSIKDSVLAERIGGARKLNGSVTIQTNLAIRGLND